MISNTSSTPDREEGFDSPSYQTFREPWENYLQFNSTENTFFNPPSPHYSEIIFTKPQNSPEPMEEEEQQIPYDEEEDMCLQKLVEDTDSAHNAHMRTQETIMSQNEQENGENGETRENEASQCSRCHSEEEEDVGSISTRESAFNDFSSIGGMEGDTDPWTFDDALSMDPMEPREPIEQNFNFDFDNEFRMKALEMIQDRPEEEKAYVNQVMPVLINSMKQVHEQCQIQITDQIIAGIIKDLLYGKELMIGAERKHFRGVVEQEMDLQRRLRPNAMVTEDDLMVQKRKEKKASKGNRNTSNLNHLNENYVSNIFQFSRRNYPQDKELQRIGNERNVSALNFRNLMSARLTDNIMARKAKARMIECGKELVGNIEYWMKDGYFNQCNDREKYILHKEKALRDLALSGQY